MAASETILRSELNPRSLNCADIYAAARRSMPSNIPTMAIA
jgi:hypothetical protein